MTTVSSDQLQNAVEWVSCNFLDNEAYICRQTGKIYWVAGDPGNQLVFDFTSQYLAQKDLLEKWYAHSDEQEAKALREWCEDEGLLLRPNAP